jgi:hypothetical protein
MGLLCIYLLVHGPVPAWLINSTSRTGIRRSEPDCKGDDDIIRTGKSFMEDGMLSEHTDSIYTCKSRSLNSSEPLDEPTSRFSSHRPVFHALFWRPRSG